MDRSKMKASAKDFKGGIPTKRKKDGTKKKTKARVRGRAGQMQKDGSDHTFKPFMM